MRACVRECLFVRARVDDEPSCTYSHPTSDHSDQQQKACLNYTTSLCFKLLNEPSSYSVGQRCCGYCVCHTMCTTVAQSSVSNQGFFPSYLPYYIFLFLQGNNSGRVTSSSANSIMIQASVLCLVVVNAFLATAATPVLER